MTMQVKRVLTNALAMLAAASTITLPLLDACAEAIVEAKPLRSANELTVEQHRQVKEADRIIEKLALFDLEKVAADAKPRYANLIAASRGLTMGFVGPVAHKFRTDRSAVSVIMGPYGSAKTTTCFQKILNSAMWQPKGPDGVRRARWAVVRDTWAHLEKNVLADWFMWFPKTKENWNETKKIHKISIAIPLKGGKVDHLEIEMLFVAVGDQSAEELFKGLQLTGLWLNEMDTLHRDVFKFGFPRVGRYRPPGTPLGGWSGMIGDMNAPAEDNWTYDFCVNRNIGVSDAQMEVFRREFGENFRIRFHRQPGGTEAGAENLRNLPPGYYQRMMIGMSEGDKRRFIDNKFGAVRDGNPVYSQYNDERHCVADMPADPNLPIHVGLDGGNTPAAVFGQKTLRGQIRIIDECVVYQPGNDQVLQGLGAKEFGQVVGKYWNEHYAGFQLGAVNWADPSAWFGDSDANAEDRAWIIKFVAGFNEAAIGVKMKMKPAPVKRNLIGPRLEAVRDVLRNVNDDAPAYVISDRCKVLREGFNRGYVVTRVQYSTGGGRWKDEPLKNDFSHVHDANQYLVLGLTKYDGWEDADKRLRDRHNAARRRGKVDFGNSPFAPRAANDNAPVRRQIAA
ncbi:hypothetical protein [Stakelama pacifica]|nr:hypothetical protein [Stakelama pacifica]